MERPVSNDQSRTASAGIKPGFAGYRRFAGKNRPPEHSSWVWLTAEMLDSPAWRALPGNAMKIVLRIALEHLKHGGADNGRLPVTYADFVKFGVRRNSIREAIEVAIALGWIDRTSVGEVPWHGDIRKPSTYGLTWLPENNGAQASNRWIKIGTHAEAKKAVKRAKATVAQHRKLPAFFNRQKKAPHLKDAGASGPTVEVRVVGPETSVLSLHDPQVPAGQPRRAR
jgi:hypothetical protein